MKSNDKSETFPPSTPAYTGFSGSQRIAAGNLGVVAVAAAKALRRGDPAPVLVFDDASGEVVEFDSRGSDAEILARLPMPPIDEAPSETAVPESRGRGRPKLGVVAREVTLLPRHWDWLATQPGGASVALRKLVEAARRAQAGKDLTRRRQEHAYRFLSVMAGNLAGFEEATRALFANDAAAFRAHAAAWPADVLAYALHLGFDRESTGAEAS